MSHCNKMSHAIMSIDTMLLVRMSHCHYCRIVIRLGEGERAKLGEGEGAKLGEGEGARLG